MGTLISFDLDCANCGYNLHKLSFDGNCPECGRSIASTLEQHVRNRPRAKFDSARLSERPRNWLGHVGQASTAAVTANLIGAGGFFLNNWTLQRYSPQRVGVLVLLCVAMTLAAYSIWRLSFAAGTRFWWMRWLLRVGAIAAIAFPILTTIAGDDRTFQLSHALRNFLQWPCTILIVVVAMGGVMRIAYVQWWLRIEGFSLFAWPLVLSALPLALFYLAIAFEGVSNFSRTGAFNSLEVFSVIPLATNSWPEVLHQIGIYFPRYWRFDIEAFFSLLVMIGHLLVIGADAAMVYSVRRARRFQTAGSSQLTPAAQEFAASFPTAPSPHPVK